MRNTIVMCLELCLVFFLSHTSLLLYLYVYNAMKSLSSIREREGGREGGRREERGREREREGGRGEEERESTLLNYLHILLHADNLSVIVILSGLHVRITQFQQL